MKINYKSNSTKQTHQVGNVIRSSSDFLYLIANNEKEELFVVNLSDNCIFGAYKTMDDLYHDVGSEDDVLVNAEINVL
ncbi:hypothetical protein [Ligilactobacillus salivarius]|uniref:hypothetical protein n=1 Tax=Ligilactobacillus salivarius TaxID=1624 RepID=UPI00136C37BA|nr:hypothetical protein [Ligilactobacillus salivarius]MYY23714.1 hypothetical protein [Ligilactobacillus salivarius]MYY40838.1 hypothetical protein [Ligilactobacillus salivarius]